MLAAARHRGERTRVVVHGSTVLGVSNTEDLPEASIATDGGLAVAFCGVLDNTSELRAAIAGTAHPVPEDREAATIAAAFQVLGQRLPSRMRGTYAVVISDGRTLWAFRDHFGFRSLFYRDDPTGVLIATEVKQVVAGANIPMRADHAVVEQIFYADYDDDTPTAVSGVCRLPKATLLRGRSDHTRTERYWHPERLIETARPSPAELQEGFDTLMAQAARRSLTGKGDVISLSGGVDSPAVAGFAAPAHRELTGLPLAALSIVAPQFPSVDESDYIREVVEFLGIDPWHTYEQHTPAVAGLDRWVQLCDGPVPTITMNEIEEHYRRARNRGYRNVLTGEFAEYVVDRPEGLLVHLLVHGRWRALRGQIRMQRSKGRPRRRIARELAAVVVPQPVTARRQRRRERMGWVRPQWLQVGFVARGWERRALAPYNRWRRSQTDVFFGPGLSLEGAEVCQTIVGLRVRRPWLDVDLWEFLLSLPAEMKYPNVPRKSVVRQLARGRVPDRILDRRDKTVFNDSMRARMDYDELKRWLTKPNQPLPGVDYATLRRRLERQELDLIEYRWARDLAAAHAFLELCGG